MVDIKWKVTRHYRDKNAAHPILKGVTDVFGPSDVYGIKRLTERHNPYAWCRDIYHEP